MASNKVVEVIMRAKDEITPTLKLTAEEVEKLQAKVAASAEKSALARIAAEDKVAKAATSAAKAQLVAEQKATKATADATAKILADALKADKARVSAAEAMAKKIAAAEQKIADEQHHADEKMKGGLTALFGERIEKITKLQGALDVLGPAAGLAASSLIGVGAAAGVVGAVGAAMWELSAAGQAAITSMDALHIPIDEADRAAIAGTALAMDGLGVSLNRATVALAADFAPAMTEATSVTGGIIDSLVQIHDSGGLAAVGLAIAQVAGQTYLEAMSNFIQGGGDYSAMLDGSGGIVDSSIHAATATDVLSVSIRALNAAQNAAALDDFNGVLIDEATAATVAAEHVKVLAAAHKSAAEAWKKQAEEKRKLIEDAYAYEQRKAAENYAALIQYQNDLADQQQAALGQTGLGGAGGAAHFLLPGEAGANQGKNVNGGLSQDDANKIAAALNSANNAAMPQDATQGAKKDADEAVHKALASIQAVFSNGFEGLFSGGKMKGIGGAIGAALDFAPIADEMLKKLPETLITTMKALPTLIAETIPEFVRAMVTEVIPALFSLIPEIFSSLWTMAGKLVELLWTEGGRVIGEWFTKAIAWLADALNPFNDGPAKAAPDHGAASGGATGGGGRGANVKVGSSPAGRAKFASGGWAPETGLYTLHRGERVIPSSGTMTGPGRQQQAATGGSGASGDGLHLHIGTLIADDAGIRELIRRINAALGSRNRNLTLG